MKLQRGQVYRIIQADGHPDFAGQRCRAVLPEQVMEVANGVPIINLHAYMLSGRFKDQVVLLPAVRLKPVATLTCKCAAYKFPHAPGLGACKTPKHEQTAPAGLDLGALFTEGKL